MENYFNLDYNFKLIVSNNNLIAINTKNKNHDSENIINHNLDYILNIFKNHNQNLKKIDYNFLLNQHYDLNTLKLFFNYLLKHDRYYKKIEIKKYEIIKIFAINKIDIFDIDFNLFDIKKIEIK